MTGSDDARIYIWDKATGELLIVLEGHDNVVNCIIGHPFEPLIASSGIDDVVKFWEPRGETPLQSELTSRIARSQTRRSIASDEEDDEETIRFGRLPPGVPGCISQ